MSQGKKPKGNNTPTNISPEERELFLNYFYQETGKSSKNTKAPNKNTTEKPISQELLDPCEKDLFIEAVTSGEVPVSKINSENINHKSIEKTPKKDSYDARLDLHGLYVEDAVNLLLDFINLSINRGRKKILVIHGKGSGAIKNTVYSLISTHPKVVNFRPAPGRLGGDGALIIKLGKNKNF